MGSNRKGIGEREAETERGAYAKVNEPLYIFLKYII